MKTINKLLPITVFFWLLLSCGESVQTEVTGSLAIKEEKKQAAPETDSSPREEITDQMPYKFDVDLPRSWKLSRLGEETLDYCDYEARLPDGFKVLDIYVLLNTRFGADNIRDLYEEALKLETLDISYKLQKENWFVISGIDKKTKNIVYWKRVFGDMYVGDLRFEYPKKKEAEIAPHIGSIAKSFTCD